MLLYLTMKLKLLTCLELFYEKQTPDYFLIHDMCRPWRPISEF
jgi:hypothetical protein